MYLFELASRHMTWLADRQAVAATNIANADTPGYRTRRMVEFDTVLDRTRLGLRQTSPLHLSASEGALPSSSLSQGDSWDEAHSGNNVSLEGELLEVSRNSRMMNIDTALTRSFHRMVLTSLRT